MHSDHEQPGIPHPQSPGPTPTDHKQWVWPGDEVTWYKKQSIMLFPA